MTPQLEHRFSIFQSLTSSLRSTFSLCSKMWRCLEVLSAFLFCHIKYVSKTRTLEFSLHAWKSQFNQISCCLPTSLIGSRCTAYCKNWRIGHLLDRTSRSSWNRATPVISETRGSWWQADIDLMAGGVRDKMLLCDWGDNRSSLIKQHDDEFLC